MYSYPGWKNVKRKEENYSKSLSSPLLDLDKESSLPPGHVARRFSPFTGHAISWEPPLWNTQEYDTTRSLNSLKFLPPLSLQVQDAQDGDDGNCKKVAIGKENYPCCSQVLF